MQGRITAGEDAWLYHKWKSEVQVDSLVQATLPPGLVEDEVDTCEALALAGRVAVRAQCKDSPSVPLRPAHKHVFLQC